MQPTLPTEQPSKETLSSEIAGSSTQKPEFSKDLIISEAAQWYPEVIEVFMDYGLHCVGCHISGFETVEEGAMGHGIVGDDLENMLADAREKIAENKGKKKIVTPK